MDPTWSHSFEDRGRFLFQDDDVHAQNRRRESLRVSGPIVEIFQRIDSARSFLVHRPPMYQADVLRAIQCLLFLLYPYAVQIAETNRPWPGPPLLGKALFSRRSPSFSSSYSIVWPQTEGVCSEWLSPEPLGANSWAIPYTAGGLYVQVLGIQEHFMNCYETQTYDNDDGDWLMSQHTLADMTFNHGGSVSDDHGTGRRLENAATYTLQLGQPPPSQCRQNQSYHTETFRPASCGSWWSPYRSSPY